MEGTYSVHFSELRKDSGTKPARCGARDPGFRGEVVPRLAAGQGEPRCGVLLLVGQFGGVRPHLDGEGVGGEFLRVAAPVPPADPGVSRLHAVLLRAPDDTWSVVDPGSANGTAVNGSEIPQGQAVPLHDGDQIHLGAWTAISVIRGG